ncbi:MAG TPA: hypothetical protein VKU19_18640 [Bryobacteraceae bacterium]|nr:hypothetical protein [Bryobacteraceae bacterium]
MFVVVEAVLMQSGDRGEAVDQFAHIFKAQSVFAEFLLRFAVLSLT